MCCIRVDKWMEKPCKSWCQHMISAWFTFSIVLIRVVVQVVMKEGVWPVETEGKDQINCPGLGTFSHCNLVPFWLFFDVFSVTTNRTILWEMSFLCILWSWKMLVKVLRKHLWVQWVKLFGCHRQQKKKNFHQWIKLKVRNFLKSKRSVDQKPLGSVVCTRP